MVKANGTFRKANPSLRGAAQITKTKNNKTKNNALPQQTSTTFAPVSISRRVSMQKPMMTSSRGRTRVVHSEYIGTVSTSTAFTCTAYQINPGLTGTFNWLFSIATNYDKYIWKGLRFHLVPAISSATAGRATLAFNFDCLDSTPTSKQQIFAIEPNAEENAWSPFSLDVPCTNEEYYVRSYLIPGSDRKTYDYGQLFYASDLGSGAATSAELYVTYDVEFFHPRPDLFNVVNFYNTTTAAVTSIFPNTTATVILGSGIIGPSSTIVNSVQINQSGRYFFTLTLTGTVITGITYAMVTGSRTQISGTSYITTAQLTAMEIIVLDVVVDPVLLYAVATFTITATTVSQARFMATPVDPTLAYVCG